MKITITNAGKDGVPDYEILSGGECWWVDGCCPSMRGDGMDAFWFDSLEGRLELGDGFEVSFCPFCGEKVEIEEK